MNLDFPVLLGMVAFVLNYVPTIGSIIAAVPAMVIALLLFGWGPLVVVGVGYLAINTVFGNLIEPSLLGRRLGLSTLVVVLSCSSGAGCGVRWERCSRCPSRWCSGSCSRTRPICAGSQCFSTSPRRRWWRATC